MSAEDDYPAHGMRGVFAELDGDTYERMCAEIDRLRQWKAEAIEVLQRWDDVAVRFNLSGEHLGKFTADAVGAEIDQMRETIAFLRR